MEKRILILFLVLFCGRFAFADSGAYMTNPYHTVNIHYTITSGTSVPDGTYTYVVDITGGGTGSSNPHYSLFTFTLSNHAGTYDLNVGAGAGIGNLAFAPTTQTGYSPIQGHTGWTVTSSSDGFSWNMNTNGTCTNGNTTLSINTPTLNPQPLPVQVKALDNAAHTFELKNPGGLIVSTQNVSPNGTVNFSYTPTKGADGVYSYGHLDFSIVPTGAYVQDGTITLSNSTAGTYSDTWSAPSVSVSLSGGVTPQLSMFGSVQNNSGRSVTLNWVDPSGAVVGTQTISNGNLGELSPPTVTLPNGGQETLKLVDTTDGNQTLGTVQVTMPLEGGTENVSGSITGTIYPPPPTTPPVQTGSQTNQGNTPTGIQSGSLNATTTVNNSNTSIGGGTTGATNQDIYNDVLQALNNSGEQYTQPGQPDFSYSAPADSDGQPSSPGYDTTTGQVDVRGLQTTIQNSGTQQAQLSTQAQNLTTQASALLPSEPSVPSQTWSWQFAVPSKYYGVSSFTVDLSGYNAILTTARSVELFTMGTLFYFAVLGYLRGALADFAKV